MFGARCLLGIQDQVDDWVTTKAVTKEWFDEDSIRMVASRAVEVESNAFDAHLKSQYMMMMLIVPS